LVGIGEGKGEGEEIGAGVFFGCAPKQPDNIIYIIILITIAMLYNDLFLTAFSFIYSLISSG